MAIRLFRTIIVSLGVLFLGSCGVLQFIFGSVFPSTMTLIKAQADLSKLIPGSNNGSTYLRLVEVGGYSYVIVTGSPSSNESFAYIYDLDLNLKKSLTGASAPAGTGVMVDASGRIAIGNEFFNAADLSLAGTNTATVYAQGNAGVDGFASGQNFIGISVPSTSSNLLTYTSYVGSWTGAGTTPTPLPTLSTNTFNLQVNAVFDDGVPTGNIIMVISQGSSGGNNNNSVNAHFVTVPKSAFISGPFPTPVFDSAPQRDNLDVDSFGYADGSIFAYDTKTSSYVRINPADASTRSSFYSGSKNQQSRFAYSVSGGLFYGFDTQTRILTKYVAWW